MRELAKKERRGTQKSPQLKCAYLMMVDQLEATIARGNEYSSTWIPALMMTGLKMMLCYDTAMRIEISCGIYR